MSKKHASCKTVLSIAFCKTVRGVLRLTGRGGTALPGKAAMAVQPDVLQTVSEGMHVIVVTGTNGKTTTCRLLEKAFSLDHKECLLNRSGANLLSGITAEFVCNADWRGRPKAEYAVIECDEGALKQVVPLIRPEVIVVTNLFRDQLDRYGEVMNTREQILTGIKKAPESLVCLNADCPLTATMTEEIENMVLYYGIDVPVGDQSPRELSDAKYCVGCGAPLSYTHYTYAHLGGWSCPECGRKRPAPQAAVTEITEQTAEYSKVRMRIRGAEGPVKVSLPAVYNLYNASAAICGGTAFGLERSILLKAAAHMSACFGRMETFSVEGVPMQMILVKNPAGFNQAAEFVSGTGEEYDLAFCLNDKTADGHDISWIWDADMEKLISAPGRRRIFVSGTRAEDMQLRMKYAGAEESEIVLEKSYEKLVPMMAESGRRVFILPNYTSMLELRALLQKKTGGAGFWKG